MATLGLTALGTASCTGALTPNGDSHVVPAGAPVAHARRAPQDALCPTSCMYVASSLNDEINVYPTSANGDVVPVQSIAGAATQLNSPFGVAVDVARNIYVTNYAYTAQAGTITVYAADSDGNAAPARTISGGSTELDYPAGIAVDAAGNIYVANYFGNSVTVYGPGANGDAAPARTLKGGKTRIKQPLGLAVDATGDIFVTSKKKVLVFGKAASGNAKPLRAMAGTNTHLTAPFGVTLDAAENVYVTDGENIFVFASGVHGDVSPVQTVTGASTGLSGPWGIGLDASGNIYVSNFLGSPSGLGSLTVYAAGADGNAAPVQTVTGASAALYGPTGLAIR